MSNDKQYAVKYTVTRDGVLEHGVHGRFMQLAEAEEQKAKCETFFRGQATVWIEGLPPPAFVVGPPVPVPAPMMFAAEPAPPVIEGPEQENEDGICEDELSELDQKHATRSTAKKSHGKHSTPHSRTNH